MKDLTKENLSLDAEKSELSIAMQNMMFDITVLNRNKCTVESQLICNNSLLVCYLTP